MSDERWIENIVDYYREHAQAYYDSTVNVDMRHLYDLVLPYLKPGAAILDLGCGSGRDSKFFLAQGFQVTAIDATAEMTRLAGENTGLEVRCLKAQELDYEHCFDLVWACASLLHVPFAEMPLVWGKIAKALVPGGIVFVSLKKGEFEGVRFDRWYCDYTVEKLERSGYQEAGLKLIDRRESFDKRPGREYEVWGNYLLGLRT